MPLVTYKEIPEYPNYKVGDDGSVWSNYGKLGWRKLTPLKSSKGYLRVRLYNNGMSKRFFIARLVLTSFVGPPPTAKHQSCHFPDRDPSNCKLCNLRWDTVMGNFNDREKHGTHPRGNANGNCKLSNEDVQKIMESIDQSAAQLSRQYEVNPCTIKRVRRGVSWKHLGIPVTKITSGRKPNKVC